jgi:D-lactate dehydrogenase (cytochrome)
MASSVAAGAVVAGIKRPLVPALAAALSERFGDRYVTSESVRQHHGRDESAFDVTPPDAVVYALSTEDVAFTLAVANQHSVPVIAYGAGSSLEGHLLAVQGGISLDLSRMNNILDIDAAEGIAVVEAGVTRKQLNEHIRQEGVFFSVDPGADATIGGMIATRASGTNAVRYGTMRENVLSLTAVTAAGEIIHTGTRARKSSAGYDLTHLLIGSEGTLAVVTQAVVKLRPVPEASSVAVGHFPDVDAAVRTASEIIQYGLPIARCELLDEMTVMALNRYSKLTLLERPMLLMEFHGSETSVSEQAAVAEEIAKQNGGEEFRWTKLPEERTKLWSARHNAYFATLQLKPGCRVFSTDACVPISKLAQCIAETRADLSANGLLATVLGHVGDGNFHVSLVIDPTNQKEWETCELFNERLVHRAIAMGGTCTGEHGVGLHKKRFLEAEHGKPAVDVMRALKRTMDPNNILNPGKIFD